MRTPILLSAACAFILTGCGTIGQEKPKTTTVGAAITAAKNGIEQYLQSAAAKKAHASLKTADFTFKVTYTAGGGMDANILCFKAGSSGTGQEVHSVTHHYGKPSQLFALSALSIGPTKSGELANQIQRDVAEQVERNVGGQPHSEITVEESFGVELKVSGAAQIPVTTITLGPNVTFARNDVQEVKLVFSVAP